MKIKRIEVKNFKAVAHQELGFDGCSAIITAGNRKGKSSILSGLIRRLQSEKPDEIVRRGEQNGFNIIELTDGSIVEWNFTELSERFTYTTKEGIRQTTGVISQIGSRYFGDGFDIDRFLNKSPKEQQNELQKAIGLDVEEVDRRYKEAYSERTLANRDLKNLTEVFEPEKVDKPDVSSKKKELDEARLHNEKIAGQNREVEKLRGIANNVYMLIKNTPLSEVMDKEKVSNIIDNEKPKEKEIDLTELESKVEDENAKEIRYQSYLRDLEAYKKYLEKLKSSQDYAVLCDEKVKEILLEREELIRSSKLPDGFGFNEKGLTYNGFALSENQISSSEKYIAALKIAEMVLGEVRTLHFDASTLDNNSLKEVQEWANSKDLQLLIERPDMDGGEIKYEIIQH